MTKKIHFLLNALLAMLAAALFSIPAAMSAFDPVNDDTDIFLANPSIAAERPNVLIVLTKRAALLGFMQSARSRRRLSRPTREPKARGSKKLARAFRR